MLLAVIIEDSPEERYGSRPFRDDLGVKSDHGGRPTAFGRARCMRFYASMPMSRLKHCSVCA